MDLRENLVTPGEFVNNRSYFKMHLLPAFGHLPTEHLDEETIDCWFAAQPPAEMRRKVYAFLRRSMRFALNLEVPPHLRVQRCRPGKGMNSAHPNWTREDFEAVLRHVPEYLRVNNCA